MEPPDNGGPAFPMPQKRNVRHFDKHGDLAGSSEAFAEAPEDDEWPGMTLRDYFAAAALTGMMGAMRTTADATEEQMATDCAAVSYKVADAMLVARDAGDEKS